MSAPAAARAEPSVQMLTPTQTASTNDLLWNYENTLRGLEILGALRPLPADLVQLDGEVNQLVEQLGAILAELHRRRKAAVAQAAALAGVGIEPGSRT